MFIGREHELKSLNERYESGRFEFPVIYGRRRIGKTTLIREFLKGKKAAYYMATEENPARQLKSCSETVLQAAGSMAASAASFSSWENLFEYVAEIAGRERFVFVIDEYPYLAGQMPSLSSILQKMIDSSWKDSHLFFVLCGSSMSFMEKQVLGYASPLYGRRTCQYRLQPLPYYESLRFFENWSDEQRLLAYGICGGVPLYLQFFSGHRNLREAVIREFMSFDGHMLEEPQNLLKQELREPGTYYDILSAIAHGAGRQNEIADKVGKERNLLSGYLANLCSLNIINKIHPAGETSGRRVLYRISDNLYRFYFRFIPGALSPIEMGLGERVYDSMIAPLLSDYFGHIFEDVCLQYVQKLMADGTIKELYTEFGRWWGSDPSRKAQTDIDVVCMSSTDILAGECKWKTDGITMDIYEELRHRASLISDGRNVHYALFSRSGFTDTVKKQAGGCMLVGMKELIALEKQSGLTTGR